MAGRPKKIKTEQLYEIIELYFKNNDVYGQVTATDLAEYANKTLKYKQIKYYDFNRNKEVKQYIDEINNGIIPVDYENKKFRKFTINIDADSIIENYHKDKKMLKTYLKQIEKKYNNLNQDKELAARTINILENENKKLKKEIIEKEKVFREKEKQLKSSIKELKSKNISLKKFRKLENIIILIEELKEKKLIKEYDYENIIMHLKNAKLIAINDNQDFTNELFDFVNEEDTDEEEFLSGIL